MEEVENVYGGEWNSVSFMTTKSGLTAREQSDRFNFEAMTELVLRLAGGLMVAGSTLLWLILPMHASTEQILSHSALSTLFAATGLFVYAYGTRGFRRQMSLDAIKGTLSLTKINMNEKGRVARDIDLDAIESLFLRRPAVRSAPASLYIRVHESEDPLLALTGNTEELEVIHQDLCEIIQASDTPSPTPRRPRAKKRLTPKLFGSDKDKENVPA